MHPEKALNTFSEIIEKENLDDINLTIYYSNVLTPLPATLNDLIKGYGQKIVVDGVQLTKHIDLIKTINNIELMQVKYESRLDARIHYIFSNKGRKIFDVTMWGFNEEGDNYEVVFINGVAVKYEDIFYEIIMPFLPDVLR